MNGSIFLIQNNTNKLVEMTEHDYPSEDLLQGFLEKYPSLLPGTQRINQISLICGCLTESQSPRY